MWQTRAGRRAGLAEAAAHGWIHAAGPGAAAAHGVHAREAGARLETTRQALCSIPSSSRAPVRMTLAGSVRGVSWGSGSRRIRRDDEAGAAHREGWRRWSWLCRTSAKEQHQLATAPRRRRCRTVMGGGRGWVGRVVRGGDLGGWRQGIPPDPFGGVAEQDVMEGGETAAARIRCAART